MSSCRAHVGGSGPHQTTGALPTCCRRGRFRLGPVPEPESPLKCHVALRLPSKNRGRHDKGRVNRVTFSDRLLVEATDKPHFGLELDTGLFVHGTLYMLHQPPEIIGGAVTRIHHKISVFV